MEAKFYHYIDESDIVRDIFEYISEYRKDPNIKFTILADKKYFFLGKYKKTLEYVSEKFKEAGINISNLEFAVNEDERRFNIFEWTNFKMIDTILTKKGIHFGFEDSRKVWDIQEVETANKKIIKTADEIKRQHLSPYEKIMMAYLKVTSRKYTTEGRDEHSAESRSVYGVLNSDKIVCVGYSELLKAIMEEVDDKNIQVYRNAVACSKDGKKIDGYHANLIVRIKDEKYGIDGFYYLDPTWDSGHENEYLETKPGETQDTRNLPDLSYFMVPLQDIDKIRFQIRGEWIDLSKDEPEPGPEPDPDPNKEPERPEPEQEVKFYEKTFHRKSDAEVHFTSDGFLISKEFIESIKKDHPEIIDIISNELGENEGTLLSKLDTCKKEIAKYATISEIIKKSGLEYIDRDKEDEFKSILAECTKTDTYDKLEDFLNQIKTDQTNFLKNFRQNLYEYLINEHYKNSFLGKLISGLKTDQPAYEEHIEYLVNNALKENPDADANALRKKFQDEKPYEKFLEFRHNQIKELTQHLEEEKEVVGMFFNALCAELDKHPELDEHFLNLYDASYRKLSLAFYDYKKDNVLNLTHIIHEIKEDSKFYKTSCRNFRMSDIINSKVMILNLDQENLTKKLKDIKTHGQDYSRFFYRGVGLGKGVDSWFKGHSEPISLTKTTQALSRVLERAHKELSDEDVENLTTSIIARTSEKVLNQYKPTASHAIVQHAVNRTQNRGGEQTD